MGVTSQPAEKTVETVLDQLQLSVTGLKPGVNERLNYSSFDAKPGAPSQSIICQSRARRSIRGFRIIWRRAAFNSSGEIKQAICCG